MISTILHQKCKIARLWAIIQYYVFTLSMESILKSKKCDSSRCYICANCNLCNLYACQLCLRCYLHLNTHAFLGWDFFCSKQTIFSDIFIRACDKALIEISCFWTCVMFPRFSACCHT